jgi:hypothetical protein
MMFLALVFLFIAVELVSAVPCYRNDMIDAKGVTIIPKTWTAVPVNAFRDCTNLTEVKWEAPSQVVTIGHNAFWSCKNLTILSSIPGSVTLIDITAFQETNISIVSYDCSSFDVFIDARAFRGAPFAENTHNAKPISNCRNVSGCDYLKGTPGRFNVPIDWKSIPSSAFYSCKALTAIDLSKGGGAVPYLTSIGSYSFAFSGLMNVTIPKRIISISQHSFLRADLNSLIFESQSQLTSIGRA